MHNQIHESWLKIKTWQRAQKLMDKVCGFKRLVLLSIPISKGTPTSAYPCLTWFHHISHFKHEIYIEWMRNLCKCKFMTLFYVPNYNFLNLLSTKLGVEILAVSGSQILSFHPHLEITLSCFLEVCDVVSHTTASSSLLEDQLLTWKSLSTGSAHISLILICYCLG